MMKSNPFTSLRFPYCIMMVGLPGSGKSTWRQKFLDSLTDDTAFPVVISSDDFIDRYAQERGLTYTDVFTEAAPLANADMYQKLGHAVKNRLSVVWDQTNLTIAGRAAKLSRFPLTYSRYSVAFELPIEEILRRQDQRPGKMIPKHVMENFVRQYQRPDVSEGFDQVHVIKE